MVQHLTSFIGGYVMKKETLRPKITCPYCDFETRDTAEAIIHFQTKHPETVKITEPTGPDEGYADIRTIQLCKMAFMGNIEKNDRIENLLDEIGDLTKSAGNDIQLMKILDQIYDKVVEIRKLLKK